jgi:hypothetical protein
VGTRLGDDIPGNPVRAHGDDGDCDGVPQFFSRRYTMRGKGWFFFASKIMKITVQKICAVVSGYYVLKTSSYVGNGIIKRPRYFLDRFRYRVFHWEK